MMDSEQAAWWHTLLEDDDDPFHSAAYSNWIAKHGYVQYTETSVKSTIASNPRLRQVHGR
jgi:hypothetical protein